MAGNELEYNTADFDDAEIVLLIMIISGNDIKKIIVEDC